MAIREQSSRSDPTSPTVIIGEWDETPPLTLSQADLTFIEQRINDDKTRLEVTHTEDQRTVLSSSRFVGVVALPDGPTIEIQPKSAGANFLRLFRYANSLDARTIDETTRVESGPQFLDALAALYVSELATVLRRGLATSYTRTAATEEYVRGQIDVQRQVQRQGLAGTQFECSYDELTADTVANRALLYAGVLLQRLVKDPSLQQALERQTIRLRRTVSLEPVTPHAVARIEVTWLNEYYRDALQLAELIIRNIYVENLREGERGSFGLLINMDQVFESVVERAVRDAVAELTDRPDWSAEGQANVTGLITGGSPRVTMRPDFVVRDGNDDVVLTGDAKWKTGRISQSDIYQLTAYQLADDVPGALIYPQQDGTVATEYTIQETYPLVVHELPTATPVTSLDELQSRLIESVQSLFHRLMK